MERAEAEAIYDSGRENVAAVLMRMDRELRERGSASARPARTAGSHLALPDRHDGVTLIPPSGARVPAQVRARGESSLELVVMIAGAPLTEDELAGTTVEFTSPDGHVRMRGHFTRRDPDAPEVLQMDDLRIVEVLEHSEFFRAPAARAIHLLLPGEDHEPIQCETVEVGTTGCLLEGPHGLQVGDDLHFEIAVVPGEPPVRGDGRVTRRDRDGRTVIAFDHIDHVDRRRLGHFISDCRMEEGFGPG